MSDIGAELRKIRLEKEIKLEEIAEKTNIPLDCLKAIEEEEFDKLASVVYAKGFVKTYANFLGLDGSALSKRVTCKKEVPFHLPGEISINRNKISKQQKRADLKNKILDYLEKHRKYIVLPIIGLIILFGLYKITNLIILGIRNISNKNDKKVELVEQEKSVKSVKPEIQKKKVEEKIIKKKDNYFINDSHLKLNLSAIKNVWVLVEIDGKVIFEGVLEKGSNEIWIGNKNIRLKISDSSSIEMSINGKPIKGFREKGKVIKNMIITKKGIEYK
jgi:cytoskeletal protein RodZ